MIGAALCNETYIARDRRSLTVSQQNNRLRKQRNRFCQLCEQPFQIKSCETARAVPCPVHSVPLSVTRRSRPRYTRYCCLRPDTILLTTQVLPFPPPTLHRLSLVLPSMSLPIPERKFTLSNWGDFPPYEMNARD